MINRMPSDLAIYLARFRRRLRLRHAWQIAQRTLWLAALAMLAIQTLGRMIPIERLWLWSLSALPAWLVIVILYPAIRPFPLMRVARQVDHELDLRERISTALAFQLQPETAPPTSDAAQPSNTLALLVTAQRQDALAAAASIRPSIAFPFTWLRRHLAAAAVIAALAVALSMLPNPMNDLLAERSAIRQEAQKQAEKIDQVRQRLEEDQKLSPEQREELIRQLRELAEQLRANPGDLEQAIADLSRLEKALQAQLDPNTAAQEANLQSLAEQLSQMAGKTPPAEQGAADAAASALQELAAQFDQLSAEERQQAAQQLAQQAAQAAQSGDNQLAQALSSLAQAMQSGDSQAVSQAAQDAQSALAQAQARLNDQEAVQSALSQAQNSRQALAQTGRAIAQAGQPGQSGAQSGNQGQPGQGQGQSGQNPGQGSQLGSGGGTNASTLPPGTRVGKPGRPQGNAPDPSASDLPSQAAAPWQRSPTGGNQVFIPGQDTGQGETQTNPGQANMPGTSNPALVPYTRVYYNYLTAANQALQTSHIPRELSTYVRDYFTQIAPR